MPNVYVADWLGLVDLFLLHVVSQLFFLRDQNIYFLRAIVHVRLCHALHDFVVSTVNLPRTGVRGFLFKVGRAIQFLKVRFSLGYLSVVARKRAYKNIVDALMPIPVYRSVYWDGRRKNFLKTREDASKAISKDILFSVT